MKTRDERVKKATKLIKEFQSDKEAMKDLDEWLKIQLNDDGMITIVDGKQKGMGDVE